MDVVEAYLIVIVVALICATVIYIFKAKQKQREREASRRDEWMNQPLETFGDQDLDDRANDLEEKYMTSEEKARRRHERESSRNREEWSGSANAYSAARDDGAGPSIHVTVNGGNVRINGGDGYAEGRDSGSGSRQSSKSKFLAFLLCFFLGGLGVHYFYCGRFGMGLLYLLTGGIFGIGWVVDLFRIALGKFPDKQGAYV